MYQIKDFDFENAVILGQWIITNYKYEQLSTVIRVLENPPMVDRIWRLTPDIIREWLSIHLDRVYTQREKEIHNERFKEVEQEGDPDPRLEEWLKELDKSDTVRPITEEEIKYEGGEKPKKPKYVPPGVEYYILAQKKIEYGRECTDLHTGKVKPGMPSFDEWLNLSK